MFLEEFMAESDGGLPEKLHEYLTNNDKRSATYRNDPTALNVHLEARQRCSRSKIQPKIAGKFASNSVYTQSPSLLGAEDPSKLFRMIPMERRRMMAALVLQALYSAEDLDSKRVGERLLQHTNIATAAA